jgi:hypothetical protein
LAAVHRIWLAWGGITAGDHLTGVGIGGQSTLVDGVAEVFSHQFTGLPVEPDQEIASRIKGDEAPGELFIQLPHGLEAMVIQRLMLA